VAASPTPAMAGGPYYFVWSGDEINSIMSYIDLNWDFSQFDRDNMNRSLTSIYINQANMILADIYRSPRAGTVSGLLLSADGHAAMALAADEINVKVEPQAWQADYKAKAVSDKFVDPVDYQRNKP
jgi:hypothetical protein